VRGSESSFRKPAFAAQRVTSRPTSTPISAPATTSERKWLSIARENATPAAITHAGQRAFRHKLPMTAQVAKAAAVWPDGNMMPRSPAQKPWNTPSSPRLATILSHITTTPVATSATARTTAARMNRDQRATRPAASKATTTAARVAGFPTSETDSRSRSGTAASTTSRASVAGPSRAKLAMITGVASKHPKISFLAAPKLAVMVISPGCDRTSEKG